MQTSNQKSFDLKQILRIVIGLVFIASGFVKAVDPKGFSFKLEEYFEAGVFNLPQLIPLALPLAIVISSVEVLLGLMLILRVRLKATLLTLTALCIFFAFLTFYSAYFNVVTDCGCFGDAVKFTPWQSFFKDLFLLIALIILWMLYRKEFAFEGNRGLKQLVLLSAALILAFVGFWGIRHEPLIDFRDYKIGTHIIEEKQKIAAVPSVYKTFYVLKNSKTGTEKKVNQDDYVADQSLWQEGSPWQILTDKTTSEMVKKGYQSEISKFKITAASGEDLTEKVLSSPQAFLIFSYKPSDLNAKQIEEAESQILEKKGLKLEVSTSRNLFSKIQNAEMDGTAIKTIARSNPFVLVLQNGKIIDKKPLEDFK